MPAREYRPCDSRLKDVLMRHAYEFKQECREQGCTESTLESDMTAIRKFIAFLCDEPVT